MFPIRFCLYIKILKIILLLQGRLERWRLPEQVLVDSIAVMRLE